MARRNAARRGSSKSQIAMAAMLDQARNGHARPTRQTIEELATTLEISKSMLYDACRVLLERPAIAELVVSGKISIRTAKELVTQGERVDCQCCQGRGYNFVRR